MDLIALDPNRSGLIRRALMGSVTQGLLCDTDCDLRVGTFVDAGLPETAVHRAPTAAQQLEHAI